MLRATPRLPEEDSTRIDPGRNRPRRSASSTIRVAAFTLTDPAKLKPSHLRKSDRPTTGCRSTYRSSSLNSCGVQMTGTSVPLLCWRGDARGMWVPGEGAAALAERLRRPGRGVDRAL